MTFLSLTKKTKTISDETDYETLEKSVKYIPWKGKKEEWYTWHNANNAEEEHALMMSYYPHKEDAEMWIRDTGATCHMKSSTEGMYNLE